jgi:hypothetical protein
MKRSSGAWGRLSGKQQRACEWPTLTNQTHPRDHPMARRRYRPQMRK